MRNIKISFRCEDCCGRDIEAVITVPADAPNERIDEIVKAEVEKIISYSWVPTDDALHDFEEVEEDR